MDSVTGNTATATPLPIPVAAPDVSAYCILDLDRQLLGAERRQRATLASVLALVERVEAAAERADRLMWPSA